MKALDLFCGGGGASRGLADAGFEVEGMDLNEQPEYPYAFKQYDVRDLIPSDLQHYDFVWASPPCQAYSTATRDQSRHEMMIPYVRRLLVESGVPYVIENVATAKKHLRNPIMLCGAMFGLDVVRHRMFETSFLIPQPRHLPHNGSIVTGEYVTVAGNGGVPSWTLKQREARGLPRHIPGEMTLERWQSAMGIDWLSRKPLTQAIPPVYSEYIACHWMEHHAPVS